MIVLDASVLIAYLDGEDDHHADAETLLAAAIDDDLGANPLTLAEVLVAPVRTGRLQSVQTALRDLEVDELPFPSDAAVRLARLRVSTGLTMADCCVLLAGEDLGASVAAIDDRLARAAEDRGLRVLGR
ncbi:MAG: type II toxin-antitoxin system VapC family toxin [Actinomycetota bacterium]|nr:type II toxin-antitoxin system VapC family toxin [Actinomycetota bacterium]